MGEGERRLVFFFFGYDLVFVFNVSRGMGNRIKWRGPNVDKVSFFKPQVDNL